MCCPNCGGVHTSACIEDAHGRRYIRCPLCGDQEYRARFNNPPIDWRLVIPSCRRTRRQRQAERRRQELKRNAYG